MKCILLAGNRKDYKPVGNKPNKALLEVAGTSIIARMLSELDQVQQISAIAVVGPLEFLKTKVETIIENKNIDKPVCFVQQGDSLIENVFLGIEGLGLSRKTQEPIFILPGDLPLVQHQEIQEFLENADMDTCDFATGLASEKALQRYYPTATQKGIKMAYFYFAEGAFRPNNFHAVRPGSVAFSEYIAKTYHLRYQKKLRNIMIMFFELLKLTIKVPTGFLFYLGMQWLRFLHTVGFHKTGDFFAVAFKIKHAERYISAILGTRYRLIPMSRAGAALDVDNDVDYQTIHARYDEWTGDTGHH